MSAHASPTSAASLGSLKKAPEGWVGWGWGGGNTHTPAYHIDLEFVYIYI